MTLRDKFLKALALIQDAAGEPVQSHVLALFVQDQGPRVGLALGADPRRNLRPLDPYQQGFASELLAQAQQMMRGPTDPQP